jgi:hypothetical protein
MINNIGSDQDSLVGRTELSNRLASFYSYNVRGPEICSDVGSEVGPDSG